MNSSRLRIFKDLLSLSLRRSPSLANLLSTTHTPFLHLASFPLIRQTTLADIAFNATTIMLSFLLVLALRQGVIIAADISYIIKRWIWASDANYELTRFWCWACSNRHIISSKAQLLGYFLHPFYIDKILLSQHTKIY